MSIEARRDVFQAIADPTRRKIIEIIGNGSMNLNSIGENFDVSRPAISQHIKILIECGLVLVNKKGRERYCYILPEKLNEVSDWLAAFSKIWEQRFDNLDNLLVNMQSKQPARKKKR